MNSIRNLLLPVLLLVSQSVSSQASLDTLLARVLKSNKNLIGAGQYYENVLHSARVNRYPENPELEFARLWGSPPEMGNRTDFAISQSFEFPGVYTMRAKLSRAGIRKASHVVNKIRQKTLLEAKQLWIEKVYLNRKWNLLRMRMDEADKIRSYLGAQLEQGEISKLRYNKAVLLQASLRNELDRLDTESAIIDAEVSRICGSASVPIEDTLYYPTDPMVLDSVLQTSLNDPLYKAYLDEVDFLGLQRKLIRAERMPKIKTGYYSEKVPGFHLQGLQLGISIPLWENAGKIEAASGKIISAELAVDKLRTDEVVSIMQLHERFMHHQKQSAELSRALQNTNDPVILARALETGEISVVEYFYESDLYYQVFNELLLTEKNMYMAESELTRYEF